MQHVPSFHQQRLDLPAQERERERERDGAASRRSRSVLTQHHASPRPPREKAGFTLIELLIYIGVFSIAAGLFTGVLTTLTKVQVRESATVEVSQQAQFVIQTVQRLVTDASIIELAANSATSTLKLRMADAAKDPTCVQLSGGVVYLMEGNDGLNKQNCFATSTPQAKALTDSKVVVNTLNFTKLANPPAKDTVKIDLTVAYNSTNPQESLTSRTLQTAITKISAATFDSDVIPSTDNFYNVGLGAQKWANGFFSNLLVGGYSSVTGGVAAFNGNVGIGTTTPSTKLDVAGGIRATLPAIGANTGQLVLYKSDGSLTTDITQLTWDSASDQMSVNGLVLLSTQIHPSGSNTLQLSNADGSAAVLINPNGGNVGIGTSTPAYKLDVQGSIKISGSGNGLIFPDATTQTTAAAAGGLASVQVFTSSGTWTKPSGVTKVIVEVIGGGGGGGGGNKDNAEGCVMAGGATGGIGGYAKDFVDVSGVASVAVTVGTGGSAGVGTFNCPGTGPGGAGNTSSFEAFVSATGGDGGLAGGAPGSVANGKGSGGVLNARGNLNFGDPGSQGTNGDVPTAGTAGGLYGGPGGGGGGKTAGGGTGANGAAGGSGVVIVWEYK